MRNCSCGRYVLETDEILCATCAHEQRWDEEAAERARAFGATACAWKHEAEDGDDDGDVPLGPLWIVAGDPEAPGARWQAYVHERNSNAPVDEFTIPRWFTLRDAEDLAARLGLPLVTV